MKTFRSAGPFSERPYFTLDEIEGTCSEELRAVGLFPAEPGPIRIERFIEKRFGVSPVYDDLPEGILGYTEFGPQGVRAIVISRSLAEERSRTAERRTNTTLGHEAGHGLLHAHLFVLGPPEPSLFDECCTDRTKILCRDDGIVGMQSGAQGRYHGRWWEFQANQAIGALLLPRSLVEEALRDLLAPSGTFGARVLPRDRRDRAVRLLSDVFDVNTPVARIRVDALYPVEAEGQLTL